MLTDMWTEEEEPSESEIPIKWGYRRRTSLPTETLAEEALASRLGWKLPFFRGLAAATQNGGSGAFRVLLPSAFLQTPGTSLEVLRVRTWMRFGNAVRQLTNVFYVAERYGAKRIEFSEPHALFEGKGAGTFHVSWSPPVRLPPNLARLVPERPGLEGDFFLIKGLGLRPGPEDEARIVAREVRPLLAPRLREPNSEILDRDVVIHFRGGDIFGSRGLAAIHNGYGQPPLAYYLAAVARERPSRVWLVFEDRRNPAVEAVAAALRGQGIEVRMQSGELAADLHVLLNAPCLVASRGTFCLAVSALSTRIRKLYLFGPPVPTLQRLGLHISEAVDVDGQYDREVMSDNWVASPAQISLMLAYPEDAIRFTDHPPVGR